MQIRWKFHFAVIQSIFMRLQNSFAHATTAQLQNFVAITGLKCVRDRTNWNYHQIWIMIRKMWYEMGPRLQFANALRPRQHGHHFGRRYFQIYFHQWKCLNFDWIFTEFCSQGPIDNTSALVQIMACCQTGDKPSSEPMMVWFPNASMRHSASMS